MRGFPAFVLSALASASFVAAQRLVVYDPVSTGGPGFLELTQPTTLVPPGSPPIAIYPEVPVLAPPPVFNVPPGDSTFDGIGGNHWYTNGLVVTGMPTPAFPPVAAPPPVFPIPAAALNAIGGPATGMALDPRGVAGGPILWLVSATGFVVGISPVAPFPIVAGRFPIPGMLQLTISGLEWDGLSGQLIANDLAGNVYFFFPGGAPAAPMLAAPAGLPGVAGDVAIDKTGMRGPFGVRSVFVVFGPIVAEMTAPGPVKPVYPTGGSPNTTGLAFLPHPAAWPVLGTCPCPTFPMTQAVTGPMSAGNLAFGITIGGLPANQIMLFAFDYFYNPAFPLINGVGCGFGMILGSPTISSGSVFSNALGVATWRFPLRVPAGTGPVFYQGGTFCPGDPMGVVITPMYQMAACGL